MLSESRVFSRVTGYSACRVLGYLNDKSNRPQIHQGDCLGSVETACSGQEIPRLMPVAQTSDIGAGSFRVENFHDMH